MKIELQSKILSMLFIIKVVIYNYSFIYKLEEGMRSLHKIERSKVILKYLFDV